MYFGAFKEHQAPTTWTVTVNAVRARQAARGEGLAALLVRRSYCPEDYHSAVAISGDACAITLYDFAIRAVGLS